MGLGLSSLWGSILLPRLFPRIQPGMSHSKELEGAEVQGKPGNQNRCGPWQVFLAWRDRISQDFPSCCKLDRIQLGSGCAQCGIVEWFGVGGSLKLIPSHPPPSLLAPLPVQAGLGHLQGSGILSRSGIYPWLEENIF